LLDFFFTFLLAQVVIGQTELCHDVSSVLCMLTIVLQND